MVELLAPAGDLACFEAALNAGADAVYVAGSKFGARAYARNFNTEELLYAIHKAHLFGKKLYLTINTLLKEEEISALVPYLIPYYEAGLDGVIVQDFGALKVMTEQFPDLEMHASTQMTVTGSRGAALLKEYGITRVVPARELSLSEMVQIKQQTGLEIEAFIHGAMCYSYSGQCLFSSMLGARSGNRGRCAGPCRLPYKTSLNGQTLNNKNELYQLSLKDLCVLEILPQLIDAGIDSFKIEGRMKSAEYVSFVTAMYRKYIDAYYADASSYKVSEADLESLRNRFSRGSIQSGYYNQQNGRNLVTLEKPGYQSFDREENGGTEQTEVTKLPKETADAMKISAYAYFEAAPYKPMTLTVTTQRESIQVFGEEPQIAQSRPVSIEDVKKQLTKTGNTSFQFETIDISLDGQLFIPNKAINELRRSALEQLKQALLSSHRREYTERAAEPQQLQQMDAQTAGMGQSGYLQLRVQTLAQLGTVCSHLTAAKGEVGRIYLSFDCLEEIHALPQNKKKSFQQTEWTQLKEKNIELVLTLPAVLRQRAVKILDQHSQLIEALDFSAFCVGNLEGLSYVRRTYPQKKCIGDSRLYSSNKQAELFLAAYGIRESICSYELHKSELKALLKKTGGQRHSYILPVYGNIPVMESAGCVLKTNRQCQRQNQTADKQQGRNRVSLIDRQHKSLTVITHCSRCENTIYNAVPLSLHKEAAEIISLPFTGVLLDFTRESEGEMLALLTSFQTLFKAAWQKNEARLLAARESFPLKEFTKGHFLKGVE